MPRRARKVERVEDEPIGSIFDSLGVTGTVEEEVVEPRTREENEPSLRDLMERINSLQSRLDTIPVQQTPVIIRQDRDQDRTADTSHLLVSYDGLPDMVQNPEQYNAELTKRINQAITAQTMAVRNSYEHRNSVQEATDRAWEQFGEDHPEWSPYKTLVGAAALELVREVESRGGDPNAFMFGNPKAFGDAIVERLKKQGYEALVESEEDDEPEAKPRKKPRTGLSEEEEETIRTAGIFGGQESGGAPSAAPAPKPGNFIKDLQDVQKHLGIYR